jgi:ferrous iron transport protein B
MTSQLPRAIPPQSDPEEGDHQTNWRSADHPSQPPNTFVLVGNPNVGKSVLFKNLTGRYVAVSNFPGTTVEIAQAKRSIGDTEATFFDTPGLNDLSSQTEDARVTLELIKQAGNKTIIQVADAKNLRRALLLTSQLAEIGLPMMLVLNMADELSRRGGHIDTQELSRVLGIPVVETVAIRDQGTTEILKLAASAQVPTPPLDTAQQALNEYEQNRSRFAWINQVLRETYSISQPNHASLGVRLGFWAMHPIKGIFLSLVSLLVVFWFVGLLGAGTLVDLLETALFEQRLSPLAIQVTDRLMPFPHQHATDSVVYTLGVPVTPVHQIVVGSWEKQALQDLYTLAPDAQLTFLQETFRFGHDFLVGQYGTLTMALSYAFAIVLPIVTTFFILFSLLEDSGYLPRMAIMVDRLFRMIGLNGKAVLPMVLGLGCDTMATMTTRILDTRKERLVTTMLLALVVPCSAQLGVLLAMMASLSIIGAISWMLLMVAILLLVGWMTSRIFPGESGDFILEIPPMRRPQLSNVLIKTMARLNWYLKEVIPLFVVGTGILFLLDRFNLLERLGKLGEPLVSGWLGLPTEMANAFLVGFMRRDFGAVYILEASTGPTPLLTPHQIFVAMVTITLFMPCFANLLMIAKEHGKRVAFNMTLFIFPFAFLVGGITHHVGKWLTNW